MGWIIFSICVICFLIYFFTEEWTGGIDVGGVVASVLLGLFCGLIICLLVCGVGGLIAAECLDSEIVNTSTYELMPSHTNDNIYVTLDGSNYNFLVVSEDGQFKSETISVTYSDVQFSDTQNPTLTIYEYDFSLPALRFIFWRTYNNHYTLTVPSNSVWLGPVID